jgi:hypothetical protein
MPIRNERLLSVIVTVRLNPESLLNAKMKTWTRKLHGRDRKIKKRVTLERCESKNSSLPR